MADDSFEYAIKKDVRNNPIVREIDRERHRQMWRTGFIGLFLVGALVFSVWRQAELLRHGYDADDLREALQEEETMRRHLLLELETLQSRAAIERQATEQLGMVEPGPDDQEVIERIVPSDPPDAAVARR